MPQSTVNRILGLRDKEKAATWSGLLVATEAYYGALHAEAEHAKFRQRTREARVIGFTLNGENRRVEVDGAVPLLWIIRETIGLTGTKFGCGVAQCGACTVLFDGAAARSCVTSLSQVEGRSVTTIEGLSKDGSHPLQKAWVAEQAPQCGYCQSGQIMSAAALLAQTPKPSRQQIVEHMNGNICRCGTYHRIIAAIERAAREG